LPDAAPKLTDLKQPRTTIESGAVATAQVQSIHPANELVEGSY
jgi:hypothetical protein